MEIHQLLAGLHRGDAISNHALALRDLLRSWGHASNLYVRDISPGVAYECRPVSEFQRREGAITIYHHSMGFDDVTRRFLRCQGKRVLIYHNITPYQFLAPYNQAVSQACKEGRERLPELHAAVDLVLGDSEYNCRELAENGFSRSRVLPIFADFQQLDQTAPCRAVLKRFDDGWTNLLFVGRLSPHKRQDDVIRIFAHYNRFIEPRSRLFLVGTSCGMENYQSELIALVKALDVEDFVIFTAHVSLTELVAYYRLADLFLCMSEHEGFCVPILEAMHFDVPVLAYHAAAVPDTLGEAGVLVSRKDHALIAEMAHLLIIDQELRDGMLHRQGERLADFRPAAVAEQFRGYIEELVSA